MRTDGHWLEHSLDSAGLGPWLWDVADNYIYRSPQHDRILGVPPPGPAHWSYQSFLDCVLPEDRARLDAEFGELQKSGREFRFEFRVRDPQGGVRWVCSFGQVGRDASGRATRFSGVVEDITLRKELEHQHRSAQEALKKSEESFRLLTENIPQIVWVNNADGSIAYYNRRWYEYTGLPTGSLEASGWQSVIHPDDLPGILRVAAEMKLQLSGVFEAEYRLRRRDGMYRWHLGRTYTLPEVGDQPFIRLGTATDIDDQKHLADERAQLRAREQVALEASQMKSIFLANMSHEIRTPMNGVIGMTTLMLSTNLDAEQREYAHSIRTSAESLLAVINDILDLSKVESGKLDLENRPFDVVELIREAIKVLEPQTRDRKVALRTDLSLDISATVVGDPNRLRQVLLNLLGNGLKFTEVGSVLLRVTPDSAAGPGNTLRFEVIDTGIGMDPSQQEKVFQPFVQADSTTTRRYGGTGLGLSISKRLVELMGGTIGCRSQKGEGSTFWFSIPLPRNLITR